MDPHRPEPLRADALGGTALLLPATAVALFVVCAAAWSLAVPAFESPDEIGHARYVNFLREQRRLPQPGAQAAGEAHQPPLYYALAAGLSTAAGWGPIDVDAGRNPRFVWYGGDGMAKYAHHAGERPPLTGTAGTLHRLRLMSVALAAATALLVFLMGRLAGMTPSAAGLVCGLVAFTPQFTFISASLNNDNLANLAGAGCLCLLLAALRSPRTAGLWWMAGAAAGLGLLAKFTTATLLACGVLAALAVGRAAGTNLRTTMVGFLAPALILPAPLLWWNQIHWGDPFGTAAQAATLPQLLDPKSLFSSYFVLEFPRVLFSSFWGTFGWMSFPMPRWVDLAFAGLTAAGLTGLLLAARRGALTKVHALLGAAAAIQLAQVVIYNLTFTQAQGRFLFPVIGAVMLLLGTGLGELWQRWSAPLAPRGAVALLVLMAAANLAVLFLWVVPGYVSAGG